MPWKQKAVLHSVFSTVPGGTHLHHLAQRYVTRSLPVDDAMFKKLVAKALEHVTLIERHWNGHIQNCRLYEFGVGSDLIIPLTYYAYGVPGQTVVDIRPLIRAGIINSGIEKFGRLTADLGLSRTPTRAVRKARLNADLRVAYGIEYKAPCDARATGLAGQSFDCVTSTDVLEHVPEPDIPAILIECRRLLRPGGLISARIDYQDHYSFVDSKISPYNFLQYNEASWQRWSPALHYQNRLRHDDHVRLVEAAGFDVIDVVTQGGSDEDARAVSALPLDRRFEGIDPRRLSIRSSYVVARRPTKSC